MEKGSKDAQKLAKAAYYSAVISLMAIYGYVAISDLTQYDRNTLSESVKKVAEKPAEIVPALRTTVAALLPTASTTRPEPEPEPDSIPEALPPPVQLAEAPQLPPVAAPGNTAIAEGYRDQLIDPSLPVDTLEMLEQKKTDIRPGAASAEYRYVDQFNRGIVDNRYTEHGLSVQVQQETASAGRFELRGDFTRAASDPPATNAFEGGHYINLTQRDLPLTGDWLMTNEVGDLRARVPSLLAQGHRVRLPEPLLEGVSSEIRSQNAMLRAETGTLGINQGATFPVFSTLYSSGSVSGLGGSYRFTPNFDVAGQAWQASEALTQTGTRSFTSYAGAARLGAVNGNRTSAGFLSSDSGAKGLWLDGEGRLAGWQHNVGAFRLDPNIDWVDRNSMVQSDIQGAYWRGATRSFRLNTSLGLDWSRNNVQDDPALNTRTARYGYTGLGYRFSPDMNLDTHLSLGDESVAGPAISTQDTTLTARGVVSNRFTSGTSTLTAATFDRSGSNDYRRSEVAWDYSWNAAGAIRGARSGVAYIRQSAVNLDTTEYQARGSLGWSGERLNLGSSVSVGYLTDPSFGNDTSANASLSLGWRLSHAWMMNGDLSYNHNTLTFGPTGDTRITSRQFRLSLRYDTRWGQPQIPFGAGTGKYGSGEIRGVLFYDKNGNGVRDPGEQGAANITVLLDNRYSAETNSNGEFSFVPVATGEHRLSVNVANIPLPWLVDERRPLIVNIRPRETGNLEIPLYSDRPN